MLFTHPFRGLIIFEMKKALTIFAQLIPFILFPFFWGLDDGLMKLHGTEAHWPKYILFVCIAYFVLSKNNWIVLAAFFGLLWKPIFDIGWSIGRGFNYIYIGETFFMDRWIRDLGLWELERNSFPVITILYLFMVFVGVGLIITEKRNLR